MIDFTGRIDPLMN